jgi:acyl dehydratase
MAKKDVLIEDVKDYVGEEIAVTDWFEIGQERVNQFAECTEDRQWIHTDREKATAGPFGGTIAHGLLLLSFIPPFFTKSLKFNLTGISIFINYGFNKIRFLTPVRVGSRIRIRYQVTEFTDKRSGRYLLKVPCTFEMEGAEKPVAVAEFLAMFVK